MGRQSYEACVVRRSRRCVDPGEPGCDVVMDVAEGSEEFDDLLGVPAVGQPQVEAGS